MKSVASCSWDNAAGRGLLNTDHGVDDDQHGEPPAERVWAHTSGGTRCRPAGWLVGAGFRGSTSSATHRDWQLRLSMANTSWAKFGMACLPRRASGFRSLPLCVHVAHRHASVQPSADSHKQSNTQPMSKDRLTPPLPRQPPTANTEAASSPSSARTPAPSP